MASRAVLFALLALLTLPHALADPPGVPPEGPDPIVGCVTFDYGPPPYAVVGNCDAVRIMMYVNSTGNETRPSDQA